MATSRKKVSKPKAFEPYVVKVTCRALNVRTEPNLKSNIVKILAKDEKCTIFSEEKGWGKTTNGWIKLEFTTKE